MEIQIDMTTRERIKATAINFIIADGYPAYFTKDNEESILDFEDIDTLIITDSPIPDLAAENEQLRAACQALVTYRDAAGPLNFQLEKADDFINGIRAAIARAEGGGE